MRCLDVCLLGRDGGEREGTSSISSGRAHARHRHRNHRGVEPAQRTRNEFAKIGQRQQVTVIIWFVHEAFVFVPQTEVPAVLRELPIVRQAQLALARSDVVRAKPSAEHKLAASTNAQDGLLGVLSNVVQIAKSAAVAVMCARSTAANSTPKNHWQMPLCGDVPLSAGFNATQHILCCIDLRCLAITAAGLAHRTWRERRSRGAETRNSTRYEVLGRTDS
jgi:hypothetical protein